jgi:predicted dehydrogenase
VLGYGSIGRRHVRALAAATSWLAIVNRRAAIRAQAEAEHPQALVMADLAALDAAEFPWRRSVAVIATWGPSHAELFHALADRGVRRILCEKPMAASVQDAHTLAQRAAREDITLAVHHYIRYAGLVKGLEQLAAEYQLGAPVSLLVSGGAACLLTNGIHWIDCAIELFGAQPQQVISTASGAPINPRAPELRLYGGTAVWRFEGEREAVLSFSNHSSIAASAQIFYRDAVVDVDGDLKVVLRRRDQAALAAFPAITRTGPAIEVLFQGHLPGVLGYLDGMREVLEEVCCAGSVRCPGAVGAAAVSACIGALVASREGRAIALPIDPESPLGREHWPIS